MRYNNKRKKEIKKIENTKRLVILLILFSFIVIGAFLFRNNQADAAAGITISGRVSDEDTKKGINGVKVELCDDKRQIFKSSKNNFY